MASEIRNILGVLVANETRAKQMFSEISGNIEYKGKSYPLLIDFEKIKPTPPELQGTAEINKWRRENWGTKCCYAYGQRKCFAWVIEFLTAWNGALELIEALSAKYPDIAMMYLHDAIITEDGLECGDYVVRNGWIHQCGNRALEGTPEFAEVKDLLEMYAEEPSEDELAKGLPCCAELLEAF